MIKYVTVEDKEYEAEISWKFHGRYYSATRETPEEFPEFFWQIEEVRAVETGEEVTDKVLLQKIEAELEKIDSDMETEAGEIENDRKSNERDERYPDED
jgi:hypothetical protein